MLFLYINIILPPQLYKYNYERNSKFQSIFLGTNQQQQPRDQESGSRNNQQGGGFSAFTGQGVQIGGSWSVYYVMIFKLFDK